MHKLLFLSGLICLTACAAGPDYVRPDIKAPDNWSVEYHTAADLANARWWQQFGDPVLDDLISASVQGNLDLKAATARVDQFLGVLDTTRSQYFPQVSAGISGGVQQQKSAMTENYQATVNASWELDLWGRIRRSNEAKTQFISGKICHSASPITPKHP